MLAIGTASSSPNSPNSLLKVRKARIKATGCRPISLPKIIGYDTFSMISATTRVTARPASKIGIDEAPLAPSSKPATKAKIGPMAGTKEISPASKPTARPKGTPIAHRPRAVTPPLISAMISRPRKKAATDLSISVRISSRDSR